METVQKVNGRICPFAGGVQADLSTNSKTKERGVQTIRLIAVLASQACFGAAKEATTMVRILMLCVCFAGCSTSKTTPASKAESAAKSSKKEASDTKQDEWTHKDLIAYVQSKGVKGFKWTKSTLADLTVLCYFTTDEKVNWEFTEIFLRNGEWDNKVLITKCESAERARDEAGASKAAFSYGRFLFRGDPDRLKQFEKVLKK
jgi:hypothetical protein